ncbi:MAG: hypothetical protein PHP13_03730 [Methanomicrobium sp.]|nr:hypothetical protein [Methanomicrobium sp.]MDD4299984.1 hypothetical protein [Methanomicrobium sp.]
MTDTAGNEQYSPVYFSFKELGTMLLFAIFAVAVIIYLPAYVLPTGTIHGFVSGIMMLPEGAGVIIFGATPCFFIILSMLLINKPWAGILTSLLIIAVILLTSGYSALHTVDVYLIAAIIIEFAFLINEKNKIWKDIVPTLLALLSIFILMQVIFRENIYAGILPANFFPFYYLIFAIVGLICAILCRFYLYRYVIAGGIANIYFLCHYFIFWGTDGLFSALPSLSSIPVLLLIALSGGVLAGLAAYFFKFILNNFILRIKDDISTI